MSIAAVREPNFFLVGASRAGTTSLWRYLASHPDIYMPSGTGKEKEPSHFCEVTPNWAFPYRDRERYLSLFAGANGARAVGEASTPYLMAPEVPARIRSAYPDARILMVLRNPADRAYSLYRFLCAIGGEWATTFEKALALEARRMGDERFTRDNPTWYGLYQYFHSGLYSAQVARYLTAFPDNQVKILLYDDLQSNGLATVQDTYSFLGVSADFAPGIERYNAGHHPRSVAVQYLIGRGMDRTVTGGIGRIRKYLMTKNLVLGRRVKWTYKPETRRQLVEAYRDDIAKTAALIGRPLDSWLKSDHLDE